MAEEFKKKEATEATFSKAFEAASSAAQKTLQYFGDRVLYKDNLAKLKPNFMDNLMQIKDNNGGVFSFSVGDAKAAKAFGDALRRSLPKDYIVSVIGPNISVEVKAKDQKFAFSDSER